MSAKTWGGCFGSAGCLVVSYPWKHTGKLEHGERRLLKVKMVNSIDDIVEYQATRRTPVEGSQECDNKKDWIREIPESVGFCNIGGTE
jgi:hypothetical protein